MRIYKVVEYRSGPSVTRINSDDDRDLTKMVRVSSLRDELIELLIEAEAEDGWIYSKDLLKRFRMIIGSRRKNG